MPSYSPRYSLRHFLPSAPPPPLRPARLLASMRERVRHGDSSLKTAKRSVHWVRRLAWRLDSLHCAERPATCPH